MLQLKEELTGIKSVAISGHVRPDGDCIGSCLAVYNYLSEQYTEIKVDIFLEDIPPTFYFLKNSDKINHAYKSDQNYDLFISLDSGDKERLGKAVPFFEEAARTICIDHHISNQGFADKNYIVSDASSTSELVYTVLEEEKISPAVAECIYTGIIHDTGVFQYSNTSEQTMMIAAKLIAKGIPFSKIIEESFYKKTYMQNQILGRVLLESVLLLDNRVIVSGLRKKDLRFYEATPKDLEGIVSQLRVTEGVECAIFLYEAGNHEYKVSMRSGDRVDVSKIASYFGGGGHKKAAGCVMIGTMHDVINNLLLHIEQQLNQNH